MRFILFIVLTLNMSGGPYIIKRMNRDKTALRVTGSEFKRYEKKIKRSKMILRWPKQRTVTEKNKLESHEETLLRWFEI